MSLSAPDLPELRPWIAGLWSSPRPAAAPSHRREHSLPNGRLHLAVRLDGAPLRLYADAGDATGRVVGAATLGGPRTGYCIKDTSQPAASVGAVLRPGASLALFGVSAAELEGQHVALQDLCGARAERLYQQLSASADPRRRQWLFERFLRAQLRPVRALDPQIAQAVGRLDAAPASAIAALAARSGHSHRVFIARFRDQVGLAPKPYAQVRRFARLLQALCASPRPAWAQLALEGGYFDQSHLIREFRRFAGVAPRQYLAAAAASPRHLPVAAGPTPAAR